MPSSQSLPTILLALGQNPDASWQRGMALVDRLFSTRQDSQRQSGSTRSAASTLTRSGPGRVVSEQIPSALRTDDPSSRSCRTRNSINSVSTVSSVKDRNPFA